jgi:hypothetical protein
VFPGRASHSALTSNRFGRLFLHRFRDLWWQRWSWITERAVSDDAPDREAARLLSTAVASRSRTTADVVWMRKAIERSTDEDRAHEDGDEDDLEAE